jgi:hypothetical protein
MLRRWRLVGIVCRGRRVGDRRAFSWGWNRAIRNGRMIAKMAEGASLFRTEVAEKGAR